jgi:threonylcarbamoyladenosine tRNA methylthiotransferase MtaB
MKAADKAAAEFFAKSIGDVRTVLFEEQDGEYVTGYTDNYIKVYAKGDKVNCFKQVKLTELYKDGMKGEY